jgi:hypothetical protein
MDVKRGNNQRGNRDHEEGITYKESRRRDHIQGFIGKEKEEESLWM